MLPGHWGFLKLPGATKVENLWYRAEVCKFLHKGLLKLRLPGPFPQDYDSVGMGLENLHFFFFFFQLSNFLLLDLTDRKLYFNKFNQNKRNIGVKKRLQKLYHYSLNM